MKRLLFGAALVLATAVQAQVTTEWVSQPGGVSIATDAADNVYTAYGVYNPGGDIFVAKRNSAGFLQWEVSYDNTDVTKHELATWVATDGAGNVVVSGTIRSGYSNPVNANSVVMKFDPQGRLLWRRVYDRMFDGSSTRKVLIDSDDNVYVLGLGMGPAGMVTTVKKFDASGNTLWSWFDQVGIGAPVNFKFTRDGAIVIAARAIYGSANGYARIDRSGNTLWWIAPVASLTVGDAAGDSFGNTYLVHGEYALSGGSVLRKVAPGGVTLWERRQPMAAFRVEVGSDDAPVLSGFPNSGTGGAAFMKYDPAGAVLWTNLDADGPAYGLLAHAQMRLDRFDNAYLAAGTMSEMAVVKVNRDGSSAWTATASFGYAAGFDFGSDNAVYVVGGTTAKFAQRAGTPTDLALALEATPLSVVQGGSISYRSTVTNLGPAAADNVVVTGTLPACALGALAVNASASCSRSIVATSVGTLTQTMTAGASASDPVPGNNSASVTTQVLPAPGADLALAITDSPDPVRVGADLVYTLRASNAGPGTASGVSLSAALPNNVAFVGASSAQGSCSGSATVVCALGALPNGATATVSITVRPRKQGTLTLTARVAASSADPNPLNDSAAAVTTVVRR